jgi:hypothetical protein
MVIFGGIERIFVAEDMLAHVNGRLTHFIHSLPKLSVIV